MIQSTTYKYTPELPLLLINKFAGNFEEKDTPSNLTKIGVLCDVNSQFAYWNEVGQFWYESIREEEQDEIEKQKPLVIQKVLTENGINILGRPTDIHFDLYELFKPQEKVFNLKGEPVVKHYILGNSTQKVVSIFYEKIYETLKYKGVDKLEFTKSITKIVFHKENNLYNETKVIESLPFDLQRQEIRNENNVLIDVVYSSVKREEMLRNERYKSEEVIKSKNPMLYNMFTQVFETSWQRYKETGDKTQLVSELQNCPIPQITLKLAEQIADEDKITFFGSVNVQFTILQLIINSLQ